MGSFRIVNALWWWIWVYKSSDMYYKMLPLYISTIMTLFMLPVAYSISHTIWTWSYYALFRWSYILVISRFKWLIYRYWWGWLHLHLTNRVIASGSATKQRILWVKLVKTDPCQGKVKHTQGKQRASFLRRTQDSKVHAANMKPTCGLSAPDGLHIGPTNLAIRYYDIRNSYATLGEARIPIESFLPKGLHLWCIFAELLLTPNASQT